jgi:hypothetical protein
MRNVLKADLVAAKMLELSGNLAAVARFFGVTRQAVQHYVKARPKLMKVMDDCRESMKDAAESSLYKAVLDGEAWAVCFFLKTQAKDRGYTERQELTARQPFGVQVIHDSGEGGIRREYVGVNLEAVLDPLTQVIHDNGGTAAQAARQQANGHTNGTLPNGERDRDS